MTKDRRLGRGLAALLGTPLNEDGEPLDVSTVSNSAPETEASIEPDPVPSSSDAAASGAEAPPNHLDEEESHEETSVSESASQTVQLNVYEIDDNPFQPRREFHAPEIASLSESLKQHDMLQPILVRRMGTRFQLISGERRLRAAIQAGWSTVPAQIREADDRLVAELAIVENLQRKDLNPIEKALSFKRYLSEHDCTQDDLAKRLKIDRSTIANLMRLLELPEQVTTAVREGSVSAGHARALLSLGDEEEQISLGRRIMAEGWSVRETERRVQERIAEMEPEEHVIPIRGSKAARRKQQKSEQVESLELGLKTTFGTKAEIRQASRGRGQIVIHFSSHAEFERIFQMLTDGTTSANTEVA